MLTDGKLAASSTDSFDRSAAAADSAASGVGEGESHSLPSLTENCLVNVRS